jgi:hypothetical protein
MLTQTKITNILCGKTPFKEAIAPLSPKEKEQLRTALDADRAAVELGGPFNEFYAKSLGITLDELKKLKLQEIDDRISLLS